MALQIIVNSLITGSIYALITFGFTLMYGTMNFFNMGYGAMVISGAYIFYVLYTLVGVPLVISVLLTFVITAALFVGIDRLCYYGFRQRRVPGWATVATSMAVNTFLFAIVTIIFGSSAVIFTTDLPTSYEILGGARITGVQIITLVTAVVLMVAMSVFLKKHRLGKEIRAISNDKTMANVVGINVERVYIVIIALSSVLASTAGILYGLDGSLKPSLSSTALLKAIVASVIGGVGNIRGALVAAFAISFIENLTVLYIGSGWRDAIPLVVVILCMVIRPSAFGIGDTE